MAQALTVLKEFYAKAGEATAFVQQKADPEIFDSAYKGMGAEGGGVVGMLEVIERKAFFKRERTDAWSDVRSPIASPSLHDMHDMTCTT